MVMRRARRNRNYNGMVIFLLAGMILPMGIGSVVAGALTEGERSLADQVNDLHRRAIGEVLPAVVILNVTKARGRESSRSFGSIGLGSGVIVDAQGFIVTNYHVVTDNDQIEAVLGDGRRFIATDVFYDEDTDLAVVKIDGQGHDLPVASFGDSDAVKVGDVVMAMGSPFSLKQTVTSGIVSFIGRDNNILGIWGYEDFIQTDADINRGNSGGPLVNLYGEVIGINSNIYSPTGTSAGYAFTIPSSRVQYVSEKLIAHGEVKRGWLGVEMPMGGGLDEIRERLSKLELLDPDWGDRNSIERKEKELLELLRVLPESLEGVVVQRVMPDSPAEAGGLKVMDVILAVNEQAVTTSKELRNFVARVLPEVTARFEVWREGARQELEVTLGDRDVAKAEIQRGREDALAQRDGRGFPPPFDFDPERFRRNREEGSSQGNKAGLGVGVLDLSPNLAPSFGYGEDEEGVVIVAVDPDSRAQRYGLKKGDILVSVNHMKIDSAVQLQEIMRYVDLSGKGVILEIRNQDGTDTVTIKGDDAE